MKLYKPFTNYIQQNYARKKAWQHRFEMLQRFAVNAMNYGHGSNFENSGELVAMKWVKAQIKSAQPVLFDVGANIGRYSITLAEVFGTNASVHSFEPSPNTFLKLQTNTTSIPNIKAHNFALSNTTGEAILYTTEKNSEVASLINLEQTTTKYGDRVTETIQMKTADDFCNEHRIEQIDFMKIDVEGFELNVLAGAQNLLQLGKIHCIQFEFGIPNIDSRTYFRDFWNLLNHQYRIYRIVEDGLFEIKTYSHNLEIFLTSNFLAVKK